MNFSSGNTAFFDEAEGGGRRAEGKMGGRQKAEGGRVKIPFAYCLLPE
jgi:hypothetical protein